MRDYKLREEEALRADDLADVLTDISKSGAALVSDIGWTTFAGAAVRLALS